MKIPRRLFPISVAGFVAAIGTRSPAATTEGEALRDALLQAAAKVGKPRWRPMLEYLAELHGRSVQPARAHFPYPFESIGPGYEGGNAFGHIDLTHIRLDTVRALPEHVRNQTRNELAGQQDDGLIPGVINFDASGKPSWKSFKGFPPLWPVAVDAYFDVTGDVSFLNECLAALTRQIGWFEKHRSLTTGGFYYLDVAQATWESGMDEGIRYDERPPTPAAAVDACSHMWMVYEHAARWSRRLMEPAEKWEARLDAQTRFVREQMWDEATGFYYDTWTVREPERRHFAFEGMWPVVVGAAKPEQAARVIDEHLLNPQRFFAPHPISTVALSDPKFELRMWRGPAWNCMTLWAARGCLRYDRPDAAKKLLEAALDATATQFERTGTIWEFYHPQIGDQLALKRKPPSRPRPCRDYLGHNPLFAMAQMWEKVSGE